MTEPFLGEIQIFGFSFAPRNWAMAAGQLLAIRQNTALFSLFGTQFGGDGTNTFALPNLAARFACGAGQSPGNSYRSIGDTFGATNVALDLTTMPMHNHIYNDYQPSDPSQLAAVPTAASGVGIAGQNIFSPFASVGQAVMLDPNAIGVAGSGSPHENRQPFVGLTYAVALVGVYPTFG